jgi:alpha-1,2-mannosyltransferase
MNRTAALAEGTWATRERIRAYALILLALTLVAIAALFATARGLNDYQGRPIGTDFSNVYAAGQYVLAGRPDAPFDPALQHAREREIFGPATPFYGWHYPPPFLAIAALLATMPYLLALAVWQLATLGLYLWNIRTILPREEVWLPALAFPAVLVNLAHGHNGFLSAALIGGALLLLDRRPVWSGILFGLLIYKPQFGILIPLVLAASGRWRAFAAAALTVLAVCAASYFAFGAAAWNAFVQSLAFTREIVLEKGDTGFHKIQSVFAAVRLFGGGVTLAYAAQAAAMLGVAASLIWLWRSQAAYALKASALIAGSMLVTPYSLDYDLMIAAPAIAFLTAYGLQAGFLRWEISALALVWIAPLLTRSLAEAVYLPLGLLATVLLFAISLRRAVRDGST